ncbi:uncharacterized protein, putative amidase [Desulfosporosinus orientis DSM 765]|uniref:Uncharacterized protein, putative amidase n=1 Tax=Desulfosporosinus orientis (strain ATCC 19365 / DSM 765 / NCIMB 8382 / VKM B-1628 / Singapore I) TaxID=768706 RepID=G7W6I2_DESOD|nr:creatininase family protein [Desulfosporosinus orientis]AET68620.1 uncharacterized protein, putative amidase [Desulfosporosinus orientis DSM 765]
MSLNYLPNMNINQVKILEEKTNIALLPVGPNEVHGQHLPAATDVLSAIDLAERTATKLQNKGMEALIAPPLNYGLADVANVFDGNTTLRYGTVANLFEDICLSLAKWGFNEIVIISGHAEPRNAEAMMEGIRRASEQNEKIKAKLSEWFFKGLPQVGSICKGAHPEWDLHAGEIETSFMLLKYPELVDMEALSKLEPNWEGEHLFERLAHGKDNFADAGAPLAYFGDPRIATKETGEKLQNFFSDIIVEEVLELIK